MLWINKKYHLMQDEILKILTWGRIASSILIVSPLIVPIAWIASKIGLHRYQYIEHRMFFTLAIVFTFWITFFLFGRLIICGSEKIAINFLFCWM